eukprot:scaffold1947_cov207-Prasinococcus_capsulatus_cf.AAC.28
MNRSGWGWGHGQWQWASLSRPVRRARGLARTRFITFIHGVPPEPSTAAHGKSLQRHLLCGDRIQPAMRRGIETPGIAGSRHVAPCDERSSRVALRSLPSQPRSFPPGVVRPWTLLSGVELHSILHGRWYA